MAGKVFFSVSMSLDGYIAPDSPAELMGRQWMELQRWAFPLRFFRENLKLGKGGEEGPDNDLARETHLRTGAVIVGERLPVIGWAGLAGICASLLILALAPATRADAEKPPRSSNSMLSHTWKEFAP